MQELIGTSQTVELARNFDIRRNYPTNKSLKSKHGSGPAMGGEAGGAAALTASSEPKSSAVMGKCRCRRLSGWTSVSKEAEYRDRGRAHSGSRGVDCTCAPIREGKRGK